MLEKLAADRIITTGDSDTSPCPSPVSQITDVAETATTTTATESNGLEHQQAKEKTDTAQESAPKTDDTTAAMDTNAVEEGNEEDGEKVGSRRGSLESKGDGDEKKRDKEQEVMQEG